MCRIEDVERLVYMNMTGIKVSNHAIAILVFLPIFLFFIFLGNGTDIWDKGVKKTEKLIFNR